MSNHDIDRKLLKDVNQKINNLDFSIKAMLSGAPAPDAFHIDLILTMNALNDLYNQFNGNKVME